MRQRLRERHHGNRQKDCPDKEGIETYNGTTLPSASVSVRRIALIKKGLKPRSNVILTAG